MAQQSTLGFSGTTGVLRTILAKTEAAPAVGYTPAAASPDDIGRALRFRACLWPFALALLWLL